MEENKAFLILQVIVSSRQSQGNEARKQQIWGMDKEIAGRSSAHLEQSEILNEKMSEVRSVSKHTNVIFF